MDMTSPIYGLIATFDEPSRLLEAAGKAFEAGYRQMDAYTPIPIEGLAEALGFHRNMVAPIVLIGGITGCLTGFFLQYYVAVINYPINVGGRPLNSWPSFIPITFELTVLFGALFALFGMLALNGLPMPYHPVFNATGFERASQDRFFLCIEASDPRFELQVTREFLRSLTAREVSEVEW